jgi:hypothetical protein
MTARFAHAPFALPQAEKAPRLLAELNALTRRHRAACPPYARVLAAHGVPAGDAAALADVPYLPVGLFKRHDLVSVPPAEVFRTLTSSGTTGQSPSRIALDRETAQRQAAALAHVMGDVLGPRRLPMLVVDTPAVVRDRRLMSARGAGVMGMMALGRDHVFALDDAMRLDLAAVRAFLAKHGGAPFFVFGFTFMVWRDFLPAARAAGLDLAHGVLVHGGGWKKLAEEAVDNAAFKRALAEGVGLRRVHSFYGMVEQVGSVFLEGEDGFLYPPYYADVIVRDPATWREAAPGAVGVIEVLSALPGSYPGHALLTEDLGIVHGTDDGACGRLGKRLTVIGRVPRAELRGCSDTRAYGAMGGAA